MIVQVNENNLKNAAYIHTVSWKESNRDVCTPEFIEAHTVKTQMEYIKNKMESGSDFYMLVDEMPIGIVSIKGELIEDLYVLPEFQNMGYGSELLDYASKNCIGVPTVWVLEGNEGAERLYEREDFRRTGNIHELSDDLIEFEMKEEKIVELDTLRLKIRRFTIEDFDDLYEYLSNKEVVKFEPYLPMNEEEVREELNRRINSPEFLAVELKENGKVIGNIYIGERENDSIELRYVFNNRYWKMGYGKEAVKNVVNYLFEIGVSRIYAETDPENENSWALLEKLDFSRVEHLKDTYVYERLRED